MTGKPTAAFLFRHPAHLLALGFGAGLAPFAPGTFGTLVAFPFAWLLRNYSSDAGFIAAVAIITVAGAWAAEVTSRHLAVADHGGIVVDEIAAFLLVLFFVGAAPLAQAIAFGLFRLFDIVKPPPIRQLDAAIKNGIGVMLDDFVAAGYTLIVFAVGVRVLDGWR